MRRINFFYYLHNLALLFVISVEHSLVFYESSLCETTKFPTGSQILPISNSGFASMIMP